MSDNQELPHIGCESDWLDLDDGEKGRLTGKLYSGLEKGDDAVMVSTVDWDVIHAAIPEGYEGGPISAAEPVVVIVTRTEDGLETSTESIKRG